MLAKPIGISKRTNCRISMQNLFIIIEEINFAPEI